jgi:hypothetical protein
VIEVHRSADGLHWLRDDVGDTFQQAYLGVGSTAWRGRAVAAGRMDDPGDASHLRTWLDGPRGWAHADLADSAAFDLRTWISTEPWLVALGSVEDGGFRGWGTTDGKTWIDVGIEGLPNAYLGGAIARDDVAVVVGESAIWAAPLESRP